MKTVLALMIVSFAFSQKYANQHDPDCHYCDDRRDIKISNIDYDDGVLTYERNGRTIYSIDDRGTLIVKGEKIKTSSEERKMLIAYVYHYENILDQSIEMGIKGANIGVTAATKALSAVFTFDLDEMERRLEKMEKEIEKKTEHLESEGEKLEYHAEEFSAIRCLLKRKIDVLDDLREF